jgi:hypothetical protein
MMPSTVPDRVRTPDGVIATGCWHVGVPAANMERWAKRIFTVSMAEKLGSQDVDPSWVGGQGAWMS